MVVAVTHASREKSAMLVQDTLYESCDGDFVSRGGEFASQARSCGQLCSSTHLVVHMKDHEGP